MVKGYGRRVQAVRHLKAVARPTREEKDGFQGTQTSRQSYKRVEAVGKTSHCRELRVKVPSKTQILIHLAGYP